MLNHFLDPPETRELRQQMVRTQLQPRHVHDARVLGAMSQIPREFFVPAEFRNAAYDDRPLPIGQGQTISQPYMVAVMAQLLQLGGNETVLEIGAGSGYGAAVLALMAKKVVAVEHIGALLEKAQARWQTLGLHNVEGVLNDGTLGWPAGGPYDGISVTAAAPEIPPSLLGQLRRKRGRLVIPVGSKAFQMLVVAHTDDQGIAVLQEQFPCVFVPLLGKEGW